MAKGFIQPPAHVQPPVAMPPPATIPPPAHLPREATIPAEIIVPGAIELSTGERVPNEAVANLTPKERDKLRELGIDAFNRYMKDKFEAAHTKLSTGDWVPNEFWGNLTKAQQDRLMAVGVDGFRTEFNSALNDMKPYTTEEGYDVVAAVGDKIPDSTLLLLFEDATVNMAKAISSALEDMEPYKFMPVKTKQALLKPMEGKVYEAEYNYDIVAALQGQEGQVPIASLLLLFGEAVVKEAQVTVAALEDMKDYKTEEGYNVADAIYQGQVPSATLSVLFSEDVIREAQAQADALRDLEDYKTEDGYNVAAAIEQGVPDATLSALFNEDVISEAKAVSVENMLLPSGEWMPNDSFAALNETMRQVVREQGLAGISLVGLSGGEVFSKYKEWNVVPEDSVYIEGGYDPETGAITTIPQEAWNELTPTMQGYVQEGGAEALEQLETAGVVEVAGKVLPVAEWEGMPRGEQFNLVYGRDPAEDEYVAFGMSEIGEKGVDFWLSIGMAFQALWPGQSDLERRHEIEQGFRREYWKEFPGMRWDPGAAAGSFIEPIFPPARALHPLVGVSEISAFEWGMGALNVALLLTPFKRISPIGAAGRIAGKVTGISADVRYIKELFGIHRAAKIAGIAKANAITKIAKAEAFHGLSPKASIAARHEILAAHQAAHRAVVALLKADTAFSKAIGGLRTITPAKLARLEILAKVPGLKKSILNVVRLQKAKDAAIASFKKRNFTSKDWGTPRYREALRRIDEAELNLSKASGNFNRVIHSRAFTDAIPASYRLFEAGEPISPWKLATHLRETPALLSKPKLTGYGMRWTTKTRVPEVFDEAFDAPIRAGAAAIATKVAAKPKFWELELTPRYKPGTKPSPKLGEVPGRPRPSTAEPKPKVSATEATPKIKVKPSVFPGIKPQVVVKTATKTEPVPLEELHRMTPEQFQRLYGAEGVQIGVHPYPLVQVTPAGAIKLAGQMQTAVQAAVQAATKAAEKAATEAMTKAMAQAAAKEQAKAQAQAMTQARAQAMAQAYAMAMAQAAVQAQVRAAAHAAMQAYAKTLTQAQVKAAVKVTSAEIVRTVTKATAKAVKTQGIKWWKLFLPLPSPGEAFRRLTPFQKKGSVGWKQGVMYKLLHPPFGRDDIINSRTPFPGVKMASGPKSAYESITKVYKGTLPSEIARDMGIMDLYIHTPKGGKGKPTLKFRRDVNQKTTLTPGAASINRR